MFSHPEYEIIEKLRAGTYCQAFKCRGKAKKDEVVNKNNGLFDEVVIKKFNTRKYAQMENSFLTRLSGHANIIKTIALIHEPEYSLLITEYGGDDLRVILESGDRINVRHIMQQLFQALAFIHGLRLIHRDVKTDNIVMRNGIIKLIDFNMSMREVDEKEFFSTYTFYTSIEQLLHINYSCPVDMWGAGIVLYELITKKMPFRGDKINIFLEDIFTKLGEIRPDDWPTGIAAAEKYCGAIEPLPEYEFYGGMDRRLKDLLRRLLIYNPAKRITAADCLEHGYFT